jgi:quinol monooxygenase YgiN
MLIVGGWFEVEPSERDAFVAGRLDSVRSSRAEKGCIEYTVAPDPADAGRVILYERWEDQASLDAHLAGMQNTPPPSGPAIAPKGVSVVVYEVSGERTLV